jgi:protein-S-isoprenylcysteine O-methyltransferase Ste14
MNQLAKKAFVSLVIFAMVMGLLLFVPAGTLRYWQGWAYLFLTLGTSLLMSIYLLSHDPALLERRMKGGPTAEQRTAQKIVMLIASLGFVSILVLPALNYRFEGSSLPLGIELAGYLLVSIGFYFIFLVYRENTFASATVGVVENQKVVSSGPYALVRHPMYAGGIVYVAGTPLALGSYWGLLGVALMLPALVWRLLDEEALLAQNLSGYTDYQRKVRYRLLPGVW